MTAPNWKHQTVWTGDNLHIMRGLNSASVDLIYLDPPFNSKADYAAPIGTKAAGAAFRDTWTLSDVDVEWINLLDQKHPALHRVLLAALTNSDKSYLTYMAIRLLEMHRLLKPTGSLYLHCDPTMSHYLKLLLDAVFGRRAFRNEIIWERTSPKGLMTRRYPTNHDVILAYERTNEAFWNVNEVFVPYDHDNLDAKTLQQYSLVDDSGRRYQLTSLLNPNKDRPNLTYEFLGITRVWRWKRERMEAEHAAGRVVQSRPGRVPRYKRFLDEQQGRPLTDIWTGVRRTSQEDVGYPTQKPLFLLDRIIRASSNPGDMVLDPFCGCATACIAAEQRDREWIGIDISEKAAELVERRMRDELGLFYDGAHRADIPRRTDLGRLPAYNSPANKRKLYGEQEGHCAGCNTHFEARHLTVDHIIARAKGGTDHIENLQLLCGNCNSIKGARNMAYLRVKLQLRGL